MAGVKRPALPRHDEGAVGCSWGLRIQLPRQQFPWGDLSVPASFNTVCSRCDSNQQITLTDPRIDAGNEAGIERGIAPPGSVGVRIMVGVRAEELLHAGVLIYSSLRERKPDKTRWLRAGRASGGRKS